MAGALRSSARWAGVTRGSKLKLIVHVGSNSPGEARKLAAQAKELNAAAIAALSPSHFKPKSLDLATPRRPRSARLLRLGGVMQYAELGATGVTISRLSLGGVALGQQYGPVTAAEVDETVRFVIDSGINFIDTSAFSS